MKQNGPLHINDLFWEASLNLQQAEDIFGSTACFQKNSLNGTVYYGV